MILKKKNIKKQHENTQKIQIIPDISIIPINIEHTHQLKDKDPLVDKEKLSYMQFTGIREKILMKNGKRYIRQIEI